MRLTRVAATVAMLVLGACGPASPGSIARSPAASPSGTATPSGLPIPSSTPAQIRAGAPAWVAVSVATEWRSPFSPRAVDAPALEAPARIRQWLAALTPPTRPT